MASGPDHESPTANDALAVLENIQAKLERITTINEAKQLADQAAALRDYTKRARKALVVQNGLGPGI